MTTGQYAVWPEPASPGPVLAAAKAVNRFSQIAGYVNDGSTSHAALQSGGAVTILDTRATSDSETFGLNTKGQVVGKEAPGGTTDVTRSRVRWL